MSTLRIAFLSGAVLEFLSTLCVALVAVEVGFRMVFGHVSLFTGLAVIMLAPEVFEPLRQVGAQFHASANGVAAAERAFEILETPIPSLAEDSEDEDSVQDDHDIDWASAAFSLRDLSIEARGTWAPAGLNADILPGTLSVLTGSSGSGKTSTIYALMRLLPIQSGHLMVCTHEGEEIPLQYIPKETLWKAITWVPQHPSLLPGSLREQLPPSTEEELEAAAALCGFTEVLDTLPQRWDSQIGQDGAGLSVGQRQRFALTRALLAQTPIVILDEPTAHLDAVSEEIVLKAMEALRKKGRTVIAIAHRQALIDAADQVISVHSRVKDQAELAEVGGEQ